MHVSMDIYSYFLSRRVCIVQEGTHTKDTNMYDEFYLTIYGVPPTHNVRDIAVNAHEVLPKQKLKGRV